MRLIARLPPPIARRLLKVAYRVARVWWRVRPSSQFGALVGLRHADRVLMVRQSYQPRWTFPGGSIEAGETAEAAARRELREEVGLDLAEGDLEASITSTHLYLARRDEVRFFTMRYDAPPVVTLDERELVEARWFTLAETMPLALSPHIRDYLRHEFGGRG